VVTDRRASISPARAPRHGLLLPRRLHARALIVPDFIQGLFVSYEGGTGLDGSTVHGRRLLRLASQRLQRDRRGLVRSASGDQGFYHGSGADDSTSTSRMQSRTSAWCSAASSSAGASTVTEWLGFDIGFGLGFGGMTGNLYPHRGLSRSHGGGRKPLRECADVGTPGCDLLRGLRASWRTPPPAASTIRASRGGTYQRFVSGDPTVDARTGHEPLLLR
jgi:hypothetical protein